MIRKSLPLLVFAARVLAAGTLHGLHSNRWQSSADLDKAVGRLDAVPESLGDWRGEKQEFDVEDLKRAGIKGHVAYRYRNVVTGERVSLLIVCGRFGPISVHTPDICYGGAGYEALGAQFRKPIAGALSVWAMQFKAPPTMSSSQIEVNWAWNGGKGWVAPDNSRWAFAGYPTLYKLYVVRDLPTVAPEQKKDPMVPFLQTFLPELEKILSR